MDDKEGKSLFLKLKSSNTDDVDNALEKIRILVKNSRKRKSFMKSSVIKLILSLIEHPKYSNISLSIIADACLERHILLEVIKYDGIQSLIRIMKSLVNDDIQNRACRALGNIAKYEVGFRAIHVMKPISTIVNFLTGTQNINCQQTAVRTLRILGKDSKSRDKVVSENGIIGIAKLLHSSHKEVLICSTKALAELTVNCNVGCARQLLEMESLKKLVELNKHSERIIRANALTSLKNISWQDEIRSDLIKAGALNVFTEIAEKYGSSELRRLAALALCNCLNYLHMWANYGVSRTAGLRALLEVLRSDELRDIHIHLVSSILPLCYENAVADILVDLEIIQILSHILKRFIAENKEDHLLFADPVPERQFLPSPKDKTASLDLGFTFTSPDTQSSTYGNNFQESTFDSSFLDFQSASYVKATKYTPKFDVSSYFTLHSSGASSQCSPSSSGSYMSPNVYSDYNPGSPIRDPWSPNSMRNLCWSPVLSCSDSSNPENELKIILDNASKQTSSIERKRIEELMSETMVCNEDTSGLNMDCEIDACNNFSRTSCDDLNYKEITEKVLQHKHELDSLSEENIEKTEFSKDNIEHFPLTKTSNHIFDKLHKIDHYILSILMQFFYLDKKGCTEYANSSFLSVLLDYVTTVKKPNPKAEKFLINIIKNKYTFEKLIKSGFVSKLETQLAVIHQLNACKQCSHLNSVHSNLLSALRLAAESDFGVGTLCHILSTADKSSQMHVLYLSTKLVTLKPALFRLIVQAKGLSLLIDFLSDTSELSSKAMLSLCQLFQNIKKSYVVCPNSCISKSPSKCAFKDVSTDVTFNIDGITVSACRKTICNSDYFRALLEGHFIESYQNVVVMQDISAETLTTIFHFLHGCNDSNPCAYIKRIPFSVLLELLHQSDKFLLQNVKSFVTDRLGHSLFHNTVSKIYKAAKECNTPGLLKQTLSFFLSMDISKKDVFFKCFQDLMKIGSCSFLSDIKIFIEETFSEYILDDTC